MFRFLLTAVLLAATHSALGTVYEVGPGRLLATPGAVPWEALQPGDSVLIHWRAAPYQDKWVICRQGTAAQPIVVRGVPGPAGELPVIDGAGAVTRTALNFWNEKRGVIKIGGASNPSDMTPKFIRLESLDIRGARPPQTFTGFAGTVQTYAANAAAIYVEKAENLTIRRCVLRDSGNGLFIGSSDALASRAIVVEGCHLHGNGNAGSIYEHNSYTAAADLVFQFNRFGPLLAGAGGNNLKDRSAGLVVRANWIEGGSRELDLVDAEDSALLRSDPAYGRTFVYGNVIIEPAGDGNSQLVHYGGDSGTTAAYRKGTLYFHHNTLVSRRTDNTTLFRLSTNDETCDFRNNIAVTAAAGSALAFTNSDGTVNLSHNWMKPGARQSFGSVTGAIHDDGTTVTGSSPGFVNEAAGDFHLAGNSTCLDAATELPAAVLPAHAPTLQYVPHQAAEPRPVNGPRDIGAYELPLPEIRSLTRDSAGAHVAFMTVLAAPYRVDYRDELRTGPWLTLEGGIIGTGDLFTAHDPAAALLVRRFYRVLLALP